MKQLFFLFLCVPAVCLAQKRIENTYDAAVLKRLIIDSDAIFEIVITAIPTDQISFQTRIDGETYESTLLTTEQKEASLILRTGHTPDFTPYNDKLSAHKVLSITLEVTIPEGLDIEVYSALASLDIKGSTGDVVASLGRGNCRLVRFRKSAQISTLSGAITVETKGAQVDAQSRNGTVVIPEGISGNEMLKLKSIHGDIVVSISQ